MAKFSFEDMTGSITAILWPQELAKHAAVLNDRLMCFVRGTFDRRWEPAKLVVRRIIPIERAPAELARGLLVRLQKGVQEPSDLERLLGLLRIRPGKLDPCLELLGAGDVGRAVYKAGNALRFEFDERLLTDLEKVLGTGKVRLLGQQTRRIDPPAR